MKPLSNQVAVVTGASKGIGAGIAKALAAAGATVVVNYASSSTGADRVVAEILARGGIAAAIHADVSNPADVERLFAETKSGFGRLDILVNNAGVFKFGPLDSITAEEFKREYAINVLGPILTVQEAIRQFGFEGGRVINVTSLAGTRSMPQALLYSSTKAALESITQGMALELGARRIRVNAVAPGYTRSEGTEAEGLYDDEANLRHFAEVTPLGRLGEPADIASAVVFLASPESAWITGESIRASGGAR
ncbi:MAG: glucose 1-dehydrogenase [Verrucomicrobiaceae bacterium]|nr:MAG: glucose 1-dehydrogenase [Verrucomicrobiaceae bacterium]